MTQMDFGPNSSAEEIPNYLLSRISVIVPLDTDASSADYYRARSFALKLIQNFVYKLPPDITSITATFSDSNFRYTTFYSREDNKSTVLLSRAAK